MSTTATAPTFTYAPEPSPFVHELLLDAKSLQEERAALQTRMEANRRMLRDLRTMGKASQEQADAIAAFYKDRESKADKADAPAADAPATGTEKAPKGK